MFCQRCGAQLPENTSKCPHCGAEYKVENTSAPIADNKKSPQKSFFTKKKIIITVIIAVILISGGMVAAITLVNGSSISISTTDMLQLADRYLKEMNYEQAIVEFQKILEIEPKNVDAYIGLAEAYVGLGETDKAIEALKQGQENTGSKKVGDRLREIQATAETTTEAVINTTEAPLTTTEMTTVETTTAVVTTTTEVIVTSTSQITTTTEDTTTTAENITTTALIATVEETNVTVSENETTVVTTTKSPAAQETTTAPIPIYATIDIPSIESNYYTVENADTLSYTGNITEADQRDSYSFTVPRDGVYLFGISNMPYSISEKYVSIYIYNSLNEIVVYKERCYDESGVVVDEMKAGEVYTIEVRQNRGYSSYTLLIWQQKPTIDISEFTYVNDSIEYGSQRNFYSFTAPRDGVYRFEIFEMPYTIYDKYLSLYIYNSFNETIAYNEHCYDESGVTINNMKADETYTIEVRQNCKFSSYTLLIGQQKPIVDISEVSSVNDGIEYKDQSNLYLFTAPRDGTYQFELSEMEYKIFGQYVYLYIYDSFGEIVACQERCYNGSVTVDNIKAGETYTIKVNQNIGFTNYTLSIELQN